MSTCCGTLLRGPWPLWGKAGTLPSCLLERASQGVVHGMFCLWKQRVSGCAWLPHPPILCSLLLHGTGYHLPFRACWFSLPPCSARAKPCCPVHLGNSWLWPAQPVGHWTAPAQYRCPRNPSSSVWEVRQTLLWSPLWVPKFPGPGTQWALRKQPDNMPVNTFKAANLPTPNCLGWSLKPERKLV